MFKPSTLVKFALRLCTRRLGVDYAQSENVRLRFFDSSSYTPTNGRSNNFDVVVWPNRIELLEYSTDPREIPCTAETFNSLRAFLQARAQKQVERSAQLWAMRKVHESGKHGLEALRDALDESKSIAAELRKNMDHFLQGSILIGILGWATRL